MKLRLLGVNDFHGHLQPPRAGVGGAAWLLAHLNEATIPGRTIRVHAGDMVGATPLISSWFHDEPTMMATNLFGFDVGTLGNHEFDEGGDELIRMLQGGQRTGPEAYKRDADGRLVNTSSPSYPGARYPYIAANTVDREGKLELPPYLVIERAGVKVGFIGVTTRSTPKFLLDRYAERFRFTDISDAVNRWVRVLQQRGVHAIVVLAHAGGPTQDERNAPDFAGEIVEEAREMSDDVDVVVAGHSHSRLDIRVPNADGSGDKLIVEALSYGIAFDLVDMTIDRRTGDVVAKSGRVLRHTARRGRRPADGELRGRLREAHRPARLQGARRDPYRPNARRREPWPARRGRRARVRRHGRGGRGPRRSPGRHRCGPDHLRRRGGGARLRPPGGPDQAQRQPAARVRR